ncbi:hypothetical protein ES708_32464 [subsurface metagenome]
MIYSCQKKGIPEGTVHFRICLAVSGNPEGTFEDIRTPLFDNGWSCIDGNIFVDDDGTPYLYFAKVGKNEADGYLFGLVYGVEMARDLSHIVGDPVLCVKADQEWENPESMDTRCNEGSFVLKMNYTLLEAITEIAAAAGFVFCLYTIWHYWPELPEQIPKHFGADGQADAWGDKKGLLMLMIHAAFPFILITILNKFPHIFNYLWTITDENAERQYRLVRLLMIELKGIVVWIFAYIIWGTIQTALGNMNGLGKFMIPMVILFPTAAIAIYLVKAYQAR